MRKVRLTVDGFSFEAAHKLNDYNGDCANLHGHSYKVAVTVEGEVGKETNGFLVDFKILKSVIEVTIKKLDHTYLNELFVNGFNPTAENLAIYLFDKISEQFETYNIKVVSVKLWETEHSCAEVVGD